MGYFKRKIDRHRSRGVVRTLHERAASQPEPGVWRAIPEGPPRKRCFLRFATLVRSSFSERLIGIFTALGTLRSSHKRVDLEALDEVLDWFGEHLPAPDLDEPKAIFFFKSDAGECTRRIWEIAHFLRAADIDVRMQLVAKPGRIVYEDEYQVAVVPWSRHVNL